MEVNNGKESDSMEEKLKKNLSKIDKFIKKEIDFNTLRLINLFLGI